MSTKQKRKATTTKQSNKKTKTEAPAVEAVEAPTEQDEQKTMKETELTSTSDTQSTSTQEMKQSTVNLFTPFKNTLFTRKQMFQMIQDRKQQIYQKGTSITVNDKMQSNYTYTLAEEIGTNFDPKFTPAYNIVV
jgi:hypothetical protein